MDEHVRKNLERDIPIEPRVRRAIHLAHPAFAKRRDDRVRAETRSGSERHALEKVRSIALTVESLVYFQRTRELPAASHRSWQCLRSVYATAAEIQLRADAGRGSRWRCRLVVLAT